MSLFKLKRRLDRVAIASALVAVISLFLPFLTFRENRLSTGNGMYIWEAGGFLTTMLFLVVVGSTVLLTILMRNKVRNYFLSGFLGNFMLIMAFLSVSIMASDILAKSGENARVSLGIGAWLFALSGYLTAMNAAKRLDAVPFLKMFISLIGFAFLTILLVSGSLSSLSIVEEYSVRKPRFLQEMGNHLRLAGVSLGLAVLFGIPFGILAYRSRPAKSSVFAFVNTVQTIPSLALFGILIAPLSFISQQSAFLRSIGIRGVGSAPAIFALTLYALLPITRNTFTSLKNLSPDLLEAGTGMGMNRIQRMRKIEFPLSIPIIFSGIRTSLVQVIGNTTIAALIGAGGFGFFVFQGFGQGAPDLIMLGAIPVIILAIVFDRTMHIIIKMITPKGLGPVNGEE